MNHIGRHLTFATTRRVVWAVATISMVTLLNESAGANQAIAHQQTNTPAFSVGVTRCTFVDRTRAVLNFSTSPPTVLARARILVTEIRYPTLSIPGGPNEINDATPVQQKGGYPMIVFAHGYDVTPDTFANLLDAWVRAGFVVAAPLFPDENRFAVAAQHGANTENDIRNEPADMTFVTRSLLAASATPTPSCALVRGMVQPTEIGLAGHSDGATAVGLLAYAQGADPQGVSFANLRSGLDYRAVVIMTGMEDPAQRYATASTNPALLIIQSAADRCNPIRNGVKLYGDLVQSNKWFLELQTAHHLPPFDGADLAAFRVVASTSTRFFRMSLEGATFPTNLLDYGSQSPNIARMFSGGPGPSVTNVPVLPVICGPN